MASRQGLGWVCGFLLLFGVTGLIASRPVLGADVGSIATSVEIPRGNYHPPALEKSLVGKTGGARIFGPYRLRPRTLSKHPLFTVLEGKMKGDLPSAGKQALAFTGDNNLYAGLWRAGDDADAAWFTMDWDDFTKKWDEFNKSNLRMIDFERFTIGSQPVYGGLFSAGSDANAAWFTSSWKNFTDKWGEFESKGLRMKDYESWLEGNTLVYGGIFRAGTGGHAAWITDDWNDFTKKWDEFGKQHLRMKDFEATPLPSGKIQYAGIFEEGNDTNAAWVTSDWNDFTAKWGQFEKQGLRMTDIETYLDGGKRMWAGIFRAGNWGHYAWVGIDWENFTAKWNELESQKLRLFDFEAYPSQCPGECLNQVVMPGCEGQPETQCRYDYGVTMTKTHCPGLPNTCGTPGPNDFVVYHQPVDTTDTTRYARLSALDVKDQLFTLPFSDHDASHNGWLYDPGNWHHAVDFSRPAAASFKVRAAAPGKVVHIGWDIWSGNTIVVSHDVGAAKDVYRTIYMHLRNGAKHDCQQAWTVTVPWLASAFPDTPLADDHYKKYLNDSACKQDGSGTPDSSRWGTESTKIDPNLLGKTVQRGDILADAGCTGPGGCGCMPKDWTSPVGTGGKGPNNHLHIFFARRDPKDNQWYFFDPYGMYAPSSCYPSGMTDALPGACARYPIAWKGGKPQYP